MKIKSYAAMAPGEELVLHEYENENLHPEEVLVEVVYCGICHSDISMIDNEWGISTYPLIPGHEVVGKIAELGNAAESKGLKIGQMVGIGWNSKSCQHCDSCINGKHVNCENGCTPTILNKGGFASHLRADWQWVIPLPDSIDLASAGPLLCGGITVFKPLLMHNINANSRIGVIGIGGLGHIAIKFARAMGAEVTAFSSSLNKVKEIIQMGADKVVNSRDLDSLMNLSDKFDLIINTVSVDLDWQPYFKALAPEGRFHTVGVVMKPFEIPSAGLINGDHSISGSSTGSPGQMRSLMKLASRAMIKPITEEYPMSEINNALRKVRSGKAHYRVVLRADFE